MQNKTIHFELISPYSPQECLERLRKHTWHLGISQELEYHAQDLYNRSPFHERGHENAHPFRHRQVGDNQWEVLLDFSACSTHLSLTGLINDETQIQGKVTLYPVPETIYKPLPFMFYILLAATMVVLFLIISVLWAYFAMLAFGFIMLFGSLEKSKRQSRTINLPHEIRTLLLDDHDTT